MRTPLRRVALLLPGLIVAGAALAASVHWSYQGEAGPEVWGRLSPEFAACAQGRRQSPIELAGAEAGEPPGIAISWAAGPAQTVNNGHTVQVNVPDGSYAVRGTKRYELLQFHVHGPAEHSVDGRLYPLELHFVHRAADGGLLVLGLLVDAGAPNPALQALWDAAPAAEGGTAGLAAFDPATLGPRDAKHYTYAGSLTTPPCSEIVTWVVYATPIEAAADQIARFATWYHGNNRPLQPRNDRVVTKSF